MLVCTVAIYTSSSVRPFPPLLDAGLVFLVNGFSTGLASSKFSWTVLDGVYLLGDGIWFLEDVSGPSSELDLSRRGIGGRGARCEVLGWMLFFGSFVR